MEILCPHCQKKLTIPDQYAGQVMKCPLCAGTFPAPALPPAPVPPIIPPPPVVAAAPSEQAYSATGAAPPMEPVPTDYTGRFSLWISPRITQYIPAVLLFLVFVLTFFPWVGIRPGGVWLDSQSAWQAAFGLTSTPDRDTEPQSWFKGKRRDKALPQPLAGQAEDPGFGVLTFFYLPLLMLNVLLAAVAAAAPYVKPLLPPAVQPYWRWRWPAAAAATLFTFALLLLQSTVGFGLERRALDAVDKVANKKEAEWTKGQKDGLYPEMEAREIPMEALIFRGVNQQAIVRTFWFRCAFWFHFWALVFVVVTMLAELRAPRPAPRVDLLW
jgi:hypothetical protein